MKSLRLAKVIAARPEGHAVDIVFLDDGSRVSSVRVLSPSGSTNSGVADLPSPTPPRSGRVGDITPTKDRDMYAVVAFLGELPIVMGFLFPEVCQLMFKDANRRVERHASDVYTSIDNEGNFELFHPSGTYMRIGTDPAHEDLTGRDFDGKWKITKNTAKQVHVQLTVKNGGATKASLNIDPNGNVTVLHVGNLATLTQGNALVEVNGTTEIVSGGDATIVAPHITLDTPVTTITGILQVLGEGAAGNVATITGDVRIVNGGLTVPDEDVVAGTISLRNHLHSGVQPGGGNTGVPVP